MALLLGIWIDRVRRWRVMLWSNLARMALIALIPLLYLTDLLTVPALLVIACLIGVASVLFDLSWMSYVPTLVKSPKHYVEASSKMGISSSTADVAGPGIAGVVVAWLTAPVALLAQTGTYLLSVVSLMLIRTREPKPEVTTERRASRELKEGLAWVFGKPLLSWRLMAAVIMHVLPGRVITSARSRVTFADLSSWGTWAWNSFSAHALKSARLMSPAPPDPRQ